MRAVLFFSAALVTLNLSAGCPPKKEVECCPPPKLDGGCCLLIPNNRCVMFEVYGDLLFLQPNGSSLYYAAQADGLDQSISIPAISPNWKIHEIQPNYSAAFQVGAKILFPNMRTNIEASWERLYSSKSASHQVFQAGQMLGPIFDIGPNSSLYSTAHGKGKFHFDAVNLVFGQEFCAFERLYPNVYLGAAFTRIKQILFSTYGNVAASTNRTIKNSSTFIGAGPRLGVDLSYRISQGFFLDNTTSLSLIIGESQNTLTFYSTSPYLISHGIPVPNTQTTSVPNRTQLVPALEEKLGFSYSWLFKCGRVKFGAGYLTQIYLNAVQLIEMTAPQVEPSLLPDNVPDSGLFAVGFERTLSNFILTGPYISLRFDF